MKLELRVSSYLREAKHVAVTIGEIQAGIEMTRAQDDVKAHTNPAEAATPNISVAARCIMAL